MTDKLSDKNVHGAKIKLKKCLSGPKKDQDKVKLSKVYLDCSALLLSRITAID